jgi:hypothetical protein
VDEAEQLSAHHGIRAEIHDAPDKDSVPSPARAYVSNEKKHEADSEEWQHGWHQRQEGRDRSIRSRHVSNPSMLQKWGAQGVPDGGQEIVNIQVSRLGV